MAEIVIVTSEPAFQVDAVGELIRSRLADQFRFTGTPDQLRNLADYLRDAADLSEAKLAKALKQEAKP
jgi:hypothetical protein